MRVGRHLLACGIYLAGYCLFVLPVLARFTTHIYSGAIDGPQFLWNYWWVRHAVTSLESPWYTDFLFHPDGISLVAGTLAPLNGLLSLPLTALFGQVAAYNLIVVFAFVATGYTMFLLAHDVTRSYWGSVVAGAVLTFSPFHFAHAGGHMNLISIEFVPLFLLTWMRFLRAPGHGRAALAALSLGAVLACDYNFAFYCGLVGALMFVYRARQLRDVYFFARLSVLLPFATFVVMCLAMGGPIVLGLLIEMADDPLVGSHDPMRFRNDLFSAVIPGACWWLADLTRSFWEAQPEGGNWYEFGSHLGMTVIGMAAFGAVRTWRESARWGLLAAGFYVLSLGPVLMVLGRDVPWLPMPYRLLELFVPGFELTGTPVRLELVTYIGAAVLTAFGVRELPRAPWLRLGVPVLLALWFVEMKLQPQKTFRPVVPPVIETLTELPDGAVAGFRGEDSVALYYQTLHGKPLPAGYVARHPQSRFDRMVELDRLRYAGSYRELMERTRSRYLVRDRAEMLPVRDEDLVCIARDYYFELYTRRPVPGVELPPIVEAPAVQIESASDAGVVVSVRAPGDGGQAFCCAFSESRRAPTRMFFNRPLALEPDAVFRTAMVPGNELFRGNWGVLGADGTARFEIARRFIRPGAKLWCSLIVFHDAARTEVRRVFRPVRIELR